MTSILQEVRACPITEMFQGVVRRSGLGYVPLLCKVGIAYPIVSRRVDHQDHEQFALQFETSPGIEVTINAVAYFRVESKVKYLYLGSAQDAYVIEDERDFHDWKVRSAY